MAGDGTICGQLFALATPVGGQAPTDTLGAALQLASHPTLNVQPLFSLIPTQTPFKPALITAPADWSLSVTQPVGIPELSLGTGAYVGSQQLTIADSSPGSIIHYTLDGTTASSASPVYSGPVVLTTSANVQATAVLGQYQSGVASSTITIAQPNSAEKKLVFIAQPADSITSAVVAPAIQVAIEDGGGNIETSASQTITLRLSSGSGLSGTLSAIPTGGVATFTNLSVGMAGSQLTLRASATGMPDVSSAPFTVSAPMSAMPVTAQWADSFVDSVGLNVHFSYTGSIYTSQTNQMVSAIQRLGVRHLRDQMTWSGTNPSSAFYAVHDQLGTLGVKTDYILTSINYPMSQVAAYPGLVNDMESVEAANEYDTSGDLNWVKIYGRNRRLCTPRFMGRVPRRTFLSSPLRLHRP